MKYAQLFANPQDAAAAVTHAVAHAIKRNNVTPASTTWAVTYSNEASAVEIFAACNFNAVVIFQHGEVVFSAGRNGQVLSYTPGRWENAVALICNEAEQAGCILPTVPHRSLTQAELEALCPDFAALEMKIAA